MKNGLCSRSSPFHQLQAAGTTHVTSRDGILFCICGDCAFSHFHRCPAHVGCRYSASPMFSFGSKDSGMKTTCRAAGEKGNQNRGRQFSDPVQSGMLQVEFCAPAESSPQDSPPPLYINTRHPPFPF